MGESKAHEFKTEQVVLVFFPLEYLVVSIDIIPEQICFMLRIYFAFVLKKKKKSSTKLICYCILISLKSKIFFS